MCFMAIQCGELAFDMDWLNILTANAISDIMVMHSLPQQQTPSHTFTCDSQTKTSPTSSNMLQEAKWISNSKISLILKFGYGQCMDNYKKNHLPKHEISPLCSLCNLSENDTCLHLLLCCTNKIQIIFAPMPTTSQPMHWLRHLYLRF